MPRRLLPALLSLVLHAGVLLLLRPAMPEDWLTADDADEAGDLDQGDAEDDTLGDALDPVDAEAAEDAAAARMAPLRVTVLVDVPVEAPKPAPPKVEPKPEPKPEPPKVAEVTKPEPPKVAEVKPEPPPEAPPAEPIVIPVPPAEEPTVAEATEPELAPPPPPPEALADVVPVEPTDEEIAAAEAEATPIAAADVDDDVDAEDVPAPPEPPKVKRDRRHPPGRRHAGKHDRAVCAVPEEIGIERTQPGHWRVDRGLVDYYASHIRELMKLAAVYRNFDVDGKPSGFRITLRRCSILRHGGLRSGDIVHSVNGIHIHDVFTAIRAYFKLRTQTDIVLEVERRKEPLTLRYELANGVKGHPRPMRPALPPATRPRPPLTVPPSTPAAR